MLGFIFSGGLLIFASPYPIYEAVTKRLPWSIAIIAIPIYLLTKSATIRIPKFTIREERTYGCSEAI